MYIFLKLHSTNQIRGGNFSSPQFFANTVIIYIFCALRAYQLFEYFILKKIFFKSFQIFSFKLALIMIRLYEYKTHDILKDISLNISPIFLQKKAIHTVNQTIRIDGFTTNIKSV